MTGWRTICIGVFGVVKDLTYRHLIIDNLKNNDLATVTN